MLEDVFPSINILEALYLEGAKVGNSSSNQIQIKELLFTR